jgi:lipopolysaccharide transport system permease protein
MQVNPHAAQPTSPISLLHSFWRNRQLIIQMTKREVVGRYKGSILGILWSFLNPLLMLTVYTFVFSVVFKARWGVSGEESKINFAIILFAGLIVHGLFAECVNRAPGLILSNVNYVKKVVFPLEILPWVVFGSALFHTSISFAVLVAAQLIFNQHMPWTAVLFPLILLPVIFATMGLSWFLASLGVYLRDIGHVTGIFTTVLLFISGVFFPISSLPDPYQTWLTLNPLAVIIEEGRNVLIFGHLPDMGRWGAMLALGLFIAWAGFAWFQKTRKGFADVL